MHTAHTTQGPETTETGTSCEQRVVRAHVLKDIPRALSTGRRPADVVVVGVRRFARSDLALGSKQAVVNWS